MIVGIEADFILTLDGATDGAWLRLTLLCGPPEGIEPTRAIAEATLRAVRRCPELAGQVAPEWVWCWAEHNLVAHLGCPNWYTFCGLGDDDVSGALRSYDLCSYDTESSDWCPVCVHVLDHPEDIRRHDHA